MLKKLLITFAGLVVFLPLCVFRFSPPARFFARWTGPLAENMDALFEEDPLSRLIAAGDVEGAREYLANHEVASRPEPVQEARHGLLIVRRVERGGSYLMYAVMKGHVEMVKLLLDYGMDPNEKVEIGGGTVLHTALFQSRGYDPFHPHQQETVLLLLKAGADLDRKDDTGRTPLDEIILNEDVALLETIVSTAEPLAQSDQRWRHIHETCGAMVEHFQKGEIKIHIESKKVRAFDTAARRFETISTLSRTGYTIEAAVDIPPSVTEEPPVVQRKVMIPGLEDEEEVAAWAPLWPQLSK